MKILYVPGRQGELVNTLFFGVTAEQVFVGITAPVHGRGYFPAIDIFYPPAALPEILRLFTAAGPRVPPPSVYIFPAADASPKIEVAVIFRLPLLRTAVLAQFPALSAVPLAPTVSVILTGETDGPRELVDPFLHLYCQVGHFYLCIAQYRGKRVSALRGWQLNRFHRTPPTPQRVA